MPNINVERIINATPEKRFTNAYEHMKNDFTQANALIFYESYKDQPLKFILDNSRMIFSEPYYGTKFYESCITDESFCAFTRLNKEHDKVSAFIEETKDQLGPTQTDLMQGLLITLENTLKETHNARLIAESIHDIDDTLEEKLTNTKNGDIKTYLIEKAGIPSAYILYAPYVKTYLSQDFCNDMVNTFAITESVDLDTWRCYIAAVIAGNKLSHDENYCEHVNALPYNERTIFHYLMERNLSDDIYNLSLKTVNKPYLFRDSQSAVNESFNMLLNDSNYDGATLDEYKYVAYEESFHMMNIEYQLSDSDEDGELTTQGYTITSETQNMEDALLNSAHFFDEGKDDDFSGDIYDDDEKEFAKKELEKRKQEELKEIRSQNKKFPNKSPSGSKKDDKKNNDEDDVSKIARNDTSKPSQPKEDLTTRVQNKAMDIEKNQMKHMGNAKKDFTKLRNAAKAVSNPPANVLHSIQKVIVDMDDKDDRRRKEYMTEPGYRKRIFKTFRLALEYGLVAKANILFIPVIQLIRHFSKKKDRRIRNELLREIQTEIHVCEEKINDANSRDDKEEKYRLIRIQDKLKAEQLRVKYNSEYV